MRTLYITEDKNKQFLFQELRQKKDFSSTVMGYTEFLRAYFFDYNDQTLFYIVDTYHVTKEIAKIYVEYLYFLKENSNYKRERLVFLQQLKQELIDHDLLFFQPMFLMWLKNYSLCFYHLTLEDTFFHNLIHTLKQTYEVEVVSFPKTERTISYFPALRMEEEVVFVCASIVRLLEQGVDSKTIYLANLSMEYRSLFLVYGTFFHLNFHFLEDTSIFSTSLVQTFLNRMHEDWTLVFEDLSQKVQTKQEEQIYNHLVQLCNSFVDFPRNESFYSYLTETLEQLKMPSVSYQEQILEIDFFHSEVSMDAHIFFVGANQGFLPVFRKDTGFLNEQDFMELQFSSIQEQNKKILEQTKDRLMYYPNLVLSYKLNTMDGECVPASILEELTLFELSFSDWFSFSSLYNQLSYAKEMDLYHKYGFVSSRLKTLFATYHMLPYRAYHNQVQPFSIQNPVFSILSYSSIDLYHRCPFRFYLAYILKLSSSHSSNSLKLGQFYHAILRESYCPNFDYEQSFLKAKEVFGELSKKEEFFLNKFHGYLKTVLTMIQEQESYSSLKNVLCEHEILCPLPNKMQFRGVIDKLYYDEDKLVVVDYKTGGLSLDFSFFNYGIGMQLPIYLYLLSKSEFCKKEVVGFYLQKVLPSVIRGDRIHTKEELLKKEYLLRGYSNSMESYIQCFDSSYQDSRVIQGMKVGSNGFYSYTKRLSSEQIHEMTLLVQEKIYEAARGIESQDFSIRPKRIGGVLKGCEYCSYQSICYKTEADVENFEEQKPEFLGGESYGMDEGTTTSN